MVAVKLEGMRSPSLTLHAVQIWEHESCKGAAVHPLICVREHRQEREGLSHRLQLSFKTSCPEQGPHRSVWQVWGQGARNIDLFFCIF